MKINPKYQVNPLESIFESFFSPLGRVNDLQELNEFEAIKYFQNPALKVSEEESLMRLDILLPGWSRNELELGYSEGLLTLIGKPQKISEQIKSVPVCNLEINLKVPEGWNVSKANAKLTDGILTIKIPQKVRAKSKAIRIS